MRDNPAFWPVTLLAGSLAILRWAGRRRDSRGYLRSRVQEPNRSVSSFI